MKVRFRKPLLASSVVALSLLAATIVPTISASADETCTIVGSPDTETLSGTSGNDVICTYGGDDTVTGNGGNDVVLITGGGDVTVTTGSGNDRIDASGADTVNVTTGPGSDVIVGSPGDDTITSGDASDTVSGGTGDDTIKTGAGNDVARGGEGDDTLWGEVGADTLNGEAGDDLIAGGDGVDKLNGGFGLNDCDYSSSEIKTKTCVYDSTGPKFILSRSKATVDSASEDRDIDFRIRATDANGVALVRFHCGASGWSSYNPLDASRDYSSSDQGWGAPTVISRAGTHSDLTLDIRVQVPRFKPSDGVACMVWGADDLNNSNVLHPTNNFFTVVCEATECDNTHPALKAISVSSVEVGLTTATARVTASVTENVNLASFYVACRLYGTIYDIGGDSSYEITHQGNQYFVSGSITVSRGQFPGLYGCHAGGADSAGNNLWDGRKDPSANILLRVRRSSGTWDDAAPRVISGTFSPNRLDVGSSSASTQFALHASDVSGITGITVTCKQTKPPQGDDPWEINIMSLGANSQQPGEWYKDSGATLTGDEHDLTYTIPVTIPFGKSPGQMSCIYRLQDSRGNWAKYVQGGVIDDSCYMCTRAPSTAQTLTVLRTPPGLPQGPSGLTFDAQLPTTGILSWTAPEFPGDPALRDYQIAYSTDSKTWKTIADGYSTTTTLPLSNLTPNKDYWFKVRGDNGGNSIPGSPGGTWSQVLKIHTPQATVPNQISDLTSIQVMTRSARVGWSYGYNGGSKITDFVAEISKDNGVSWKKITHSVSTAVTMNITGLTSATHYKLRLRARNAIGLSIESILEFDTASEIVQAMVRG